MVSSQKAMVDTLTRVRVAYDAHINPLPSSWSSHGYVAVGNFLDATTANEVAQDVSNLEVKIDDPNVTLNLGLRGRYRNLTGKDYGDVPKVVELIVSTAKAVAGVFNEVDRETGKAGKKVLNGQVQQNRAGLEVGSKGEWVDVEGGEGVEVEVIYYVRGGGGGRVKVGGDVVELGEGNVMVMVDRKRGTEVEREGEGEEEQGVVRVWMYKAEDDNV
ncbi:hypothetical protein TrCOL_g12874 [Triparma columacea]|uniref:Uncharacterized protein n=1 Tax=Triparma columacea TaxID=722753 RepID=A0A9W7L309_9STRA|nr:hypothetical protein TrCOL_g12874 [Triparma columacea]